MQEDKEAVFDAADTVESCLSVFCGMLQEIIVNKENMYQSALGGYTNATDAADWLVKKGLTFREAHEAVGRLVLLAINKKSSLNDLAISDFKSISDIFDETIYQAISVEVCVNARDQRDGPAESAVLKEIERSTKLLLAMKEEMEQRRMCTLCIL